MRFARALAGIAVLGTAMLVCTDGLVSQEKKDKSSGKITGQLPSGWKDLNLTAAQKEEVYKLNAEYKAKADKLRKEIEDLDSELKKKRIAVLNDEQKKKLVESVTGEGVPKTKEKKEK